MLDADFARLAMLAGAQHGLFHIDQAIALGIARRAVTRCGSSGSLERIHPQVWRFPASPDTELQRIVAGALQVGPLAIPSHESALWLGGVTNIPFAVVTTVGPEDNQRHPGIRVHRMCDLHPEFVTEVDGIRCTTIARAVVDVSSVFRRDRLDDLIDRVTITDRLTSLGAIDRALRRANTRGRRNIQLLRTLLDRRRPTGSTPRSEAERLADELISRSSLPRPLHEYPHPAWELGDAFVDRAWPEAMLILEVDSRSWHARERAMTKDRARDRSAGRAGWFTARTTYTELRDEPDTVREDLLSLYETRRRQLGR
jgi:hypothetical protein